MSQRVDVARAAPLPRSVVNRRTFVLTGFWGSIAAVAAAIVGGWGIDFLRPKKLSGFGTPVDVKASKVPAPGAEPVHVAEGRFWLVNVAPGEGESPGGLLAFYQKCPHLGCSVPWRPDFTREGGILVAGPSSRNMDTMAITVKPNGDITVQTSQVTQGGQDNPSRAVPYPGQGG